MFPRILFLLLLLTVSVKSHDLLNSKPSRAEDVISSNEIKIRSKRGVFWDFFQKVFTTATLVYDQYNDTKTTLDEIYNIVSDGFSDPVPKKKKLAQSTTSISVTAASSSPESSDNSTMQTSTTTEKYRISRYELGRLLGRNYRGLQRLFRIELNDALNQSHYNIAEYQMEAKKIFSNSIILEKKEKFKGLKG